MKIFFLLSFASSALEEGRLTLVIALDWDSGNQLFSAASIIDSLCDIWPVNCSLPQFPSAKQILKAHLNFLTIFGVSIILFETETFPANILILTVWAPGWIFQSLPEGKTWIQIWTFQAENGLSDTIPFRSEGFLLSPTWNKKFWSLDSCHKLALSFSSCSSDHTSFVCHLWVDCNFWGAGTIPDYGHIKCLAEWGPSLSWELYVLFCNYKIDRGVTPNQD